MRFYGDTLRGMKERTWKNLKSLPDSRVSGKESVSAVGCSEVKV